MRIAITCVQLIILVAVVQVSVGISTPKKNAAENAIKSLVGKDLIRLIPPIPNKSYGIAKITDIKILSLTLPIVRITETLSTLTVHLSNFGVKASANWSAKKKVLFFTLRAHGSITASANGVGINITLRKRPLAVTGCNDWIKDLNVDIKGRNIIGKIMSWLTRVFKKFIIRFLKRQLRGKLCQAATKLIEKNASKISDLLGL